MNVVGANQLKRHAGSLLTDARSMFVLTVFIQQFSIFSLLVWRRKFFTRWRTEIVLFFLMSRILIMHFSLRERPAYVQVWPVELPETPTKAALHILFIPLLLGRHCLAFLLHERAASLLCLTHLGMVILSNFTRCGFELADVPVQGQRYLQSVNMIRTFLTRWFPFPSIFPFDSNTGTLNLTDMGACVILKSTMQVAIGYCVPMAVLLAEESFSRTSFRQRHGVSDTFTYPASIIILQYLALIPFQAALTFHAAAFLLQWVGV